MTRVPRPPALGRKVNLLSSWHSAQFWLLGKALGWEFVQPLLVKLEKEEDGTLIVSDDVFAVYGVGDTESKAMQDYAVSLTDYYELLAERAREDDPATQALFLRLQSYIRAV